MKRTTVFLPEDLKTRIEITARREGRSEAEVIRAALESYTGPRARRPKLPLFDSRRGDVAERVDDLLAEGFGRD